MKALTVQQPWAWAIFHGKDIESDHGCRKCPRRTTAAHIRGSASAWWTPTRSGAVLEPGSAPSSIDTSTSPPPPAPVRRRPDNRGGALMPIRECGRGTHTGRCPNVHGQPAYGTGSRVVLTVAHLNHTPEDCDDNNLKAMCQGCHLHYDIDHHQQTAQRTRTAALEAQMDSLFDDPAVVANG